MSESTDPIPQMGHVKDGEVTEASIGPEPEAVVSIPPNVGDGVKRYTANSIYASSSIHRDEEFVILAAYEAKEKANRILAKTLVQLGEAMTTLRVELAAARARADKLEALMKRAFDLLDDFDVTHPKLSRDFAALTSLEGGQKPDSRQAADS